jgi:hypothetical protein
VISRLNLHHIVRCQILFPSRDGRSIFFGRPPRDVAQGVTTGQIHQGLNGLQTATGVKGPQSLQQTILHQWFIVVGQSLMQRQSCDPLLLSLATKPQTRQANHPPSHGYERTPAAAPLLNLRPCKLNKHRLEYQNSPRRQHT